MRHHAGTQTLPQLREHPKQKSVYADHHCCFRALVDVTDAESCRRKQNAGGSIGGPGDELLLQVAAKNGFLANSCRHRNSDPQNNFDGTLRSKEAYVWSHALIVQQLCYPSEHEQSDDPKQKRNSQIAEEFFGTLPAGAGDFLQRGAATV